MVLSLTWCDLVVETLPGEGQTPVRPFLPFLLARVPPPQTEGFPDVSTPTVVSTTPD